VAEIVKLYGIYGHDHPLLEIFLIKPDLMKNIVKKA
jgi:hypothetical protein